MANFHSFQMLGSLRRLPFRIHSFLRLYCPFLLVSWSAEENDIFACEQVPGFFIWFCFRSQFGANCKYSKACFLKILN